MNNDSDSPPETVPPDQARESIPDDLDEDPTRHAPSWGRALLRDVHAMAERVANVQSDFGAHARAEQSHQATVLAHLATLRDALLDTSQRTITNTQAIARLARNLEQIADAHEQQLADHEERLTSLERIVGVPRTRE
jgi:hypothetical protein